MKVGLTIATLAIIASIAAGIVWFGITANQHARQPSIARLLTLQAQTMPQAKNADPTKQAVTAAPFHFYSPINDPPPATTPAERFRWSLHLRTLELEDVTPDLTGPPLANVYAEEAVKAKKGDVQAATLLFEGLNYCNMETQGSLDNKQEFDQTLARMRRTDSDRYGNRTENLPAAIARTTQLYRYCVGLKSRYITLAHWALIAQKSGNPAILMWTLGFGDNFSQKSRHMSVAEREVYIQKAQEKNQTIIEQAAETGVPRAWMYLWYRYYVGISPQPMDPMRSYASLYTEYMLTKSHALAFQIWEESQCLNSLQIKEGEALARKSYRAIETRKSEVSKANKTSHVWPWNSEQSIPKAVGYRFGNCLHAVMLSQLGK